MADQIHLWEILVPTLWKESKPVRTKHHYEQKAIMLGIATGKLYL